MHVNALPSHRAPAAFRRLLAAAAAGLVALPLLAQAPPAIATFSPAPDCRTHAGQTAVFRARAPGTGMKYSWSVDGSPIGGSSSALELLTSPHDPRWRTVAVKVTRGGGEPTILIWRLEVVPPWESFHNSPPVIVDALPGGSMEILGSETLPLSVIAWDGDTPDSLDYRWTVDGRAHWQEKSAFGLSGADLSPGRHEVTVRVRDRRSDADGTRDEVTWTVERVDEDPGNRPAFIRGVQPRGWPRIAEGSALTLKAVAEDLDDDRLTYRWEVDGSRVPGSGSVFLYRGEGIGEHWVKVTVDGGPRTEASVHEWKVEVVDGNLRRPRPEDSGMVELAWDRVTEDVQGEREKLGGYRIYTAAEGGDFRNPVVIGRTQRVRLFHLEPGREYSFAVTAFDQDGNESRRSRAVKVRVPE